MKVTVDPSIKKKLYSQRSKALEIETRRVNLLERIENKFQQNSNFEQKLDKLIEFHNRRATALETRNKLIEHKNKLIEQKNKLLFTLIQCQKNKDS